MPPPTPQMESDRFAGERDLFIRMRRRRIASIMLILAFFVGGYLLMTTIAPRHLKVVPLAVGAFGFVFNLALALIWRCQRCGSRLHGLTARTCRVCGAKF